MVEPRSVWRTRVARLAAVGAPIVLVLAGLAPARAVPTATPLFDWSVPPGFGEARDDRGRLIETEPSEVREGPWVVTFRVAESVCGHGFTLQWTAQESRVENAGECVYQASFPREGSYDVRLSASDGSRELSDTQAVRVEDRLIVSIGDSVASGEALPDVPDLDRAIWQSARCHRSARAGTALAAAQIERDDPHSSVTFVHLACSGAEIEKGLLGGYEGVEPPPSEPKLEPQVTVLNRLAEVREVDAVLISIGANDVGFGPIVQFCAAPGGDCFTRRYGKHDTLSAYVTDALDRLAANYVELGDRISADIPRERIRIVDYFDPTHNAEGKTCARILLGVQRGELEQAQKQVLDPLNRAVATAADRNRWLAVTGMGERFAEHGYCAGRDAWVTTLSHSVVRLGGRFQGRFYGTLHPNDAGQAVIGGEIAASLERSFFGGEFIFRPPPVIKRGAAPLPVYGVVLIALGAFVALYAARNLSRGIASVQRVVAGVAVGLIGLALVVAAIGLRDSVKTGAALAIGGGAIAASAPPRLRE